MSAWSSHSKKNLIHYGNDCLDARLNMNIKTIILVAVAGLLTTTLLIELLWEPKRKLHLTTRSNSDETISKTPRLTISKNSTQRENTLNNLDELDEANKLWTKFNLNIPDRNELEDLILKDGKIEHMIAAGIILQDATLLQSALDLDPKNPHILFLLALEESVETVTKLLLAKTLLEEQPDNLIASYLLSSIYIDLGEFDNAINTMLGTQKQNSFNDYFKESANIVNNCLVEFNNAEAGASFYSIFNLPLPMGIKYRQISKFLKENFDRSEPDQKMIFRKITAKMGSSLVEQRGLLINELIGISIQKMSMDDMNENDESPFHGITVLEARENIRLQKEEIRKSAVTDIDQIPDLEDKTISRWCELVLEKGEFEANRWLKDSATN